MGKDSAGNQLLWYKSYKPYERRRMARYKDYSYTQGVFLPISFHDQIIPGTFEYALKVPR